MPSSDYVRISYVIPPPSSSPPRLTLPSLGTNRNGSIRPLLVPHASLSPKRGTTQSKSLNNRFYGHHPRHRLGVSSLVLDSTTYLQGKECPEGILYSGGRDGQIIAWDLSLKTRKKNKKISQNGVGVSRDRWEVLTGWADDVVDDGDDEDAIELDTDIFGDSVNASTTRTRRINQLLHSAQVEDAWELDPDFVAHHPTFRQSIQIHNDWINDILLCNSNQTVISASSDGSIRAWSPHASSPTDPAMLGVHEDYVRCLAASSYQPWVASGSFDRTIKLWDPSRTIPAIPTHNKSTLSPLSTLSLPSPSQKASIYAIATDKCGTVIASGSPERIVRIWDPRNGKKVGKLVGHTDNIRAIVLSDDGRYVLTGSADGAKVYYFIHTPCSKLLASVKLWSLASQRCLHTFAHHTESVWALWSQHPSLDIFYSGDRSGIVCRVDVEGCNTIDEGECLVICSTTRQSDGEHSDIDDTSSEFLRLQDGAGINRIAAVDDRFIWTSTSTSDIKQWKTPPRRSQRSMLPLERPHRRFSGSSELQTHSASDMGMTISLDGSITLQLDPSENRIAASSSQPDLAAPDEHTLYGVPYRSLVKLISPSDTYITGGRFQGKREADVATLYSAASVKSIPTFGIRPNASTISPISPNADTFTYPSALSPVFASPRAEMSLAPTPRTDYESRDLAAMAIPLETEPVSIIQGEYGIVRSIVLNDRMHALTIDTSGCVAVWDIVRCQCVGYYNRDDILAAFGSPSTDAGTESENDFHSPRELLEVVRERIEGECVISPWSTVDTRIGNLTVHLSEKCFEAEIYADEAGYGADRPFDTEQRLNVAKWLLANLFDHFIREEAKIYHKAHPSSGPSHRRHAQPSEEKGDTKRKAWGSNKTISVSVNAPSMIPAIPISKRTDSDSSSHSLQTPVPSAASTVLKPRLSGDAPLSPKNMNSKDVDYFSSKSKRASVVNTAPDDFSGWSGPGTAKDANTLLTPSFTPSSPGGGGLMGKLRQFGKGSKRPSSGEVVNNPNTPTTVIPGTQETESKQDLSLNRAETEQSAYLRSVTTQGLHTPSTSDAPPLHLPLDTQVIFASETQAGWTNIYRGSVRNTGHDIHMLETTMPLWLMQYLLSNQVPVVPNIKFSFGIALWTGDDKSNETSNSPSRLTANRFLRVRKILAYIQDKIDKPPSRSESHTSISSTTPRSSVDGSRKTSTTTSHSNTSLQLEASRRTRPEDTYELLCNNIILPLNMTLATIRHYIWRSGNELLLLYRRKH